MRLLKALIRGKPVRTRRPIPSSAKGIGALHRVAVILPLLGVVSACGESADSFDGPWEAKDDIVRVEPDPVLALGVIQGDPEEQFDGIVQVGIAEDSLLLIVDAGSRTVRTFYRDGRFLEESGGRGQGPGELLFVADAWMRTEGGVGVVDGGQARTTTYFPGGTFSVENRPQIGTDGPYLMVHWKGKISDTWIAATEDFVPHPPPGEAIQLILTVRLRADTGFVGDEVVEVPSVWWYTTRAGRQIRLPPVLSPLPRVRVNRSTVAVLDPANARVAMLASDQRWREIGLEPRCPPIPEAFLEPGDEAEALRGGIPLVEFRSIAPECLPAYDQLAVTGDGRAWVRETRPDRADGGPDQWWVIEGIDGPVRRAELPANFVPMDGDGEFVYGRWVDSLDVHYVRGYRWKR